MSTIFSIGEIAKIFNISTQTLRLYDRIDLLKPCHVNEETGYRYYSIGQFVILECIKRYKAMGFSLEAIKELIDNDSSIESMLDMTKRQKNSIKNKIEELKLMEKQINTLENKINDSIKAGFNEIKFIKNNERIFMVYSEKPFTTQEELEVISRKAILKIEEKQKMLKYDISFTISYDDILNHNKVIYKSLQVQKDNYKYSIEEDIIKMPEGTYLTMYFDDSSIDNRNHYNKMIDFIKENNIKVKGDFLETTIFLRVNKDGKENTLAKLEILCES